LTGKEADEAIANCRNTVENFLPFGIISTPIQANSAQTENRSAKNNLKYKKKENGSKIVADPIYHCSQ
jgi:hypothetical protein